MGLGRSKARSVYGSATHLLPVWTLVRSTAPVGSAVGVGMRLVILDVQDGAGIVTPAHLITQIPSAALVEEVVGHRVRNRSREERGPALLPVSVAGAGANVVPAPVP